MKIGTSSVIVRCVSSLLLLGFTSKTSVFGRRILNGQIANPNLFTCVVHLTTWEDGEDSICGGAVISNHFILTAAHCLDGIQCDDTEIGQSSWRDGDGPTFFGNKCYMHPDYKSESFAHDIGLLETVDDLLKDPEFSKCNLPIPETTYSIGTPAVIVGWGETETGNISKGLKYANVRVSDWDDCNYEYKHSEACGDKMFCPPQEIPKYSFCTMGDPPNPPGTCSGDSGGPVFINNVIAGVVSGLITDKKDVCIIGTPSLQILVSEYVPWIMTIADL